MIMEFRSCNCIHGFLSFLTRCLHYYINIFISVCVLLFTRSAFFQKVWMRSELSIIHLFCFAPLRFLSHCDGILLMCTLHVDCALNPCSFVICWCWTNKCRTFRRQRCEKTTAWIAFCWTQFSSLFALFHLFLSLLLSARTHLFQSNVEKRWSAKQTITQTEHADEEGGEL